MTTARPWRDGQCQNAPSTDPVFDPPGILARSGSTALLALASLVGASGADWSAGAGYRSAPLAVSQSGKTGFTALPASATGIVFTNSLSEQRHLTNQILLNGSGVRIN